MKLLDRLGFYGDKRLLVVGLKPASDHYQLLLLRKTADQLLVDQNWDKLDVAGLYEVANSYPGIALFLSLHIENPVEKGLSSISTDPVSEVMGVRISDQDAYVLQSLPLSKEGSWVSIFRKAVLETEMDKIQGIRNRIIGVNLSRAAPCFLLPALPDYNPDSAYQFEDFSWQNGLQLQESNTSIIIDRQDLAKAMEVQKELISPFASGLMYYLFPNETLLNLPNITMQRKRISLFSRLSTISLATLGMCVLAAMLLLCALGIMAGFKQYYMQEVAENRAALQTMDSQQSEIAKLSSFISQSKKLGIMPTKLSLYLDRTAKAAPAGIKLHNWHYHPSEDALQKIDRSLIEIAPPLILSGSAQSKQPISFFVKALEGLAFTEKVQLFRSDFHFDEGRQHFIILLWPYASS